jgi:hypothetical protein
MTPWQTLGVAPDVAVADLRRRYAVLIKEFRPETHPQDFARIREAYEVALPVARRREAAAAEAETQDEIAMAEAPAGQAIAEPAPPPADPSPPEPADTPRGFEQEGAATIEVSLAVAPPDDEAGAAEPGLAARFHRFHALAGAAEGTNDEAFLPALRALLQARAGASLDDSQALEFALLRWFIESERPPLTLLFEAGRAFDWHLHPARLSSWLSPWALRQMEARLALARDLVWARHFGGNPWLRRLHSAANPMTLVASRPATLAALGWAERWRHGCEDADVPALAEAQNPRTLRRLQGRELLSTDLLMGLLFAATATNLAEAATWAAIGTVLSLGLRLALLWLRPAPGRWRLPESVARLVIAYPAAALALVAVLAMVGVGLAGAAERAGTDGWMAAAALLLAPAALLGLLAIWHGLAWLERGVAELGAWREAVDRLEFDGFLRRRTLPDAAAPFGTRWTLRERLKAIPAARRLQRVELATRQRPARPPLFTRTRFAWKHSSRSRMVWIALWVLFAILRGIHAFGN